MDRKGEGDMVGRRIKGELVEINSSQVEMLASSSGSRNTVGTVVEKDGKMTTVSRGGVKMIGCFHHEVYNRAIEAHSGDKGEVSVKFSDYSQKHVGKYLLNDTVYDILADIMRYKRISKICDSETKEEIDEDTKISTLLEENRLHHLIAVVVERESGALRLPEKSAKKIPSYEGVGGVDPDLQKYLLDAHAGCLPIEECLDDTNSDSDTDTDAQEQTIDAQPGFPYDEVSDYVSPEGKTINIGECSVTFPPGCFEKTQRVTVSVSINPDKWPDGKVGITPTLHVRAHDLKVPAIVKMKTWCVYNDGNGDLGVEVLHFDEDAKDWNTFHSCQLGQSTIIEFRTSHFSDLLVILVLLGALKSSYAVRVKPFVSFHKERLAIATTLDHKLAEEACIERIRREIAKDATVHSYNAFECQYSTPIVSKIFSAHHQRDFTFTPTEVEHTLQHIYQACGSFISHITLESNREPTRITLSFEVFKNKTRWDYQTFPYYWRTEVQRPTSEQTESNCPGTSAGNIHDSRGRSRGGAAISSQVMGQLTEKNRDHLTIFASHAGGSRDFIRRDVGPSGTMTQENEGGTNLEGNIPPDVMKLAIVTQADLKKHEMAMAADIVEVCVRFSDFSRKFERAYRPKDRVHDIISDIMENKRISHICDSETGEKIHESTKLSILQKEDRLDRLKAIVVEQ